MNMSLGETSWNGWKIIYFDRKSFSLFNVVVSFSSIGKFHNNYNASLLIASHGFN